MVLNKSTIILGTSSLSVNVCAINYINIELKQKLLRTIQCRIKNSASSAIIDTPEMSLQKTPKYTIFASMKICLLLS